MGLKHVFRLFELTDVTVDLRVQFFKNAMELDDKEEYTLDDMKEFVEA